MFHYFQVILRCVSFSRRIGFMPYAKGIATFAKSSAQKLIKPSIDNGVLVNFWSPGYYIENQTADAAGKKITQKKFIRTATFTAALAYLKEKYSQEDFLKLKENASPGHVSVRTKNAYLSVGPGDVGSLSAVGIQTQHRMNFIQNFEMDVLSFERPPESMIDFYTLSSEDIEKTIHEFKSSETFYSLLGSRLFSNSGESCATSSFIVLEAGGIQELFSINKRFMAKHGVLTPNMLKNYTEEAQAVEQEQYPELTEVSDKTKKEMNLYTQDLLIRSKKIKKTQDPEQSSTLNHDQNGDLSPGRLKK